MSWGAHGGGRTRVWRSVQTAHGQAAALLIVSGTLSLVANLLPGPEQPRWANVVVTCAVVAGVVIGWLPWDRWHERATLAIVPVGLGLVAVGQVAMSGESPALYGLWFMLVFAWIGSWHPPRTSLVVAPVATLFYVAPFLPFLPSASDEALWTVTIAIPMAVMLGEVMAAKTAGAEAAHHALQETTALLERANLTDDLTGVGNRRRATALLDSLQPGDGLVVLDLDHFKVVNDSLGHAAGDEILSRFGDHLRRSSRSGDTAARFGGEEFLLVVRSAGGELVEIAERLLAGWRLLETEVTVSAGATLHRVGRGPQATFAAADELLYRAKTEGRDRVVSDVAGPAGSPGVTLDLVDVDGASPAA